MQSEYSPDILLDLKHFFKLWMRHLNEWVVRSQNLKKFNVISQIGVGGQARVYKVLNKNPNSQHGTGGAALASNNNNNPNTLNNSVFQPGDDLKSSPSADILASGVGASNPRFFAIKIFSKKKYETLDKIEHLQMVDEIRVMRELKYCANTLKLFKIFESDKYINLLLEYHEGGTLAEKLERQVKFTEDEARLIAA